MVAHGKIGGVGAVVAVFDFSFMGGSMGVAVGEGLLAAARLAVLQQAPLVVIPASGGARMQEGILSLMQLPRTTIAVQEVKAAGLPYIVLLTDPTTGGVSASFAMLGDVTLAEPGAVIGFAGARVIEETIREKLPEGFQRAEYLLEHGMVDMVVPAPRLEGDARTAPRSALPTPRRRRWWCRCCRVPPGRPLPDRSTASWSGCTGSIRASSISRSTASSDCWRRSDIPSVGCRR